MQADQYAKSLAGLREVELKLEGGSISWAFEELASLETEQFSGIDANVRVKTVGFEGAVRYYFFLADLLGFFQSLRKCHSDLKGSATLQSETGLFQLMVELNEQGHVEAHGTLNCDYSETTLSFRLKGDQSYLHEFFRSIGGPAR